MKNFGPQIQAKFNLNFRDSLNLLDFRVFETTAIKEVIRFKPHALEFQMRKSQISTRNIDP